MPFKQIKAKPIKAREMQQALKTVLFAEAKYVEADYLKTVQTWKRKITFTVRLQEFSGRYEFFVGTDNQFYYMTDITGAQPHPIVPVHAEALTIPTGFLPKTKVGVIGSSQGGRSGDIQLRKAVKHPGFKARGFSIEIAKKLEKQLPEKLRKAMRQVAEVSGHRL